MRIAEAPESVRVAMAVHPEYNDRFWRYVRGLKSSPEGIRQITDNVWELRTPGGRATVEYDIEFPREDPSNRAAWHSTLRRDGMSLNPMDTFMYLADFTHAPTTVSLRVPSDWIAATPVRTIETRELLDSPLMLGHLCRWQFEAGGATHNVYYWRLPTATPFDTLAFADAIRKVATNAIDVFGSAPYSRFDFLLQDGAWGALEHANAVTIGMPSRDLATNPNAYLDEVAHEFFHSWNLVRLYPEGRGVVSERDPAHSTGLWFSEGVTMYYANALLHRAVLPERGMSRKDLLAEQLEEYLANPGNAIISPELASAREVDTTGINGDYEPNYYTQGRLIGTVLDIIVRDSTQGRRGLDDVMRAMYSDFALKRGFTSRDIERVTNSVCGCDLHQFFESHVRNAHPIDFNRYLASVGLRAEIDTTPAVDSANNPLGDTRVWAYPPKRGGRMRIFIQDPRSVWAKSGLHTGMEIVAFNGAKVDSFPDFRRALRPIKYGDVVPVDVLRGGTVARINVKVTGYDRVTARIVDIPSATPAQVERRNRWLAAAK